MSIEADLEYKTRLSTAWPTDFVLKFPEPLQSFSGDRR